MLIYSFVTDYQAFNLRYKDNTARDKNETKVGKQSANLGKNNEPIQNRLSFLIDCKSVILHHLTILSFPMVRPAWDNGGYSRYATIMIVLGTTYIIYSRQYKRKLYITLVIYSIGLLSLRSKMFGFYIAFVCVMFLWKKVSVKKLVSLKMVILFSFMIIAVIYVAKEKIEFYFIDGLFADNMFARPLLYVKAIDILNDFPFFGTGFGSYATFASAEYYSPLYYTYDLYISPEIGRGLYISDSYFPVFAQFGYVGFVLFVCFWFRLLKIAKTNFEIYNNELLFKLTILIFIFFIIESIADSTFTHNRGMVMLMLLAIILNNKYEAKDVLITSDPNLLIK